MCTKVLSVLEERAVPLMKMVPQISVRSSLFKYCWVFNLLVLFLLGLLTTESGVLGTANTMLFPHSVMSDFVSHILELCHSVCVSVCLYVCVCVCIIAYLPIATFLFQSLLWLISLQPHVIVVCTIFYPPLYWHIYCIWHSTKLLCDKKLLGLFYKWANRSQE